ARALGLQHVPAVPRHRSAGRERLTPPAEAPGAVVQVCRRRRLPCRLPTAASSSPAPGRAWVARWPWHSRTRARGWPCWPGAPGPGAARGEPGQEPFLVQADVTDEAGVRAAVAAVAERYGRIDGLVNNAATFAGFTPLANITLEMFDHTFAVNARGAFLCARE